jgi:hypothetical protein
LRVSRKSGRRDGLAINLQTAPRLRLSPRRRPRAQQSTGRPLFRPLKHNGKRRDQREAWTIPKSGVIFRDVLNQSAA